MKSADGLLDERGDLSSVRNAWAEIVENIDRGQFSVYIHGYFCYIVYDQQRPK
jgi:hypothetical protein